MIRSLIRSYATISRGLVHSGEAVNRLLHNVDHVHVMGSSLSSVDFVARPPKGLQPLFVAAFQTTRIGQRPMFAHQRAAQAQLQRCRARPSGVGGVHHQVMRNTAVTDWLARTAPAAQLVASVCTGAFVLAEVGLLDGHAATTHWEDIPALRAGYPQIEVIAHQRWVDQGNIITSGGISAGIDMSLHLVARLASTELAVRTARQMEFDWQANDEK